MQAHRSAPPSFAALDDPEYAQAFTRPAATGPYQESRLVVDGMHCAQCAQTIERALRCLPGVIEAEVNLATRRARIVWDAARTGISAAFEAIAALGYQPFPVQHAEAELGRQRERRRTLWRLFVAGFCMMQVMMYASAAYFALPGEMPADVDRLLKWASWMLTLPVLLFSSGPFFSSAWRGLKARRIGMDVPVALGIAITFAASSWALFEGTGEVYFDSLTMFVFFLLGGRYLEAAAREKAMLSLESLARVLPEHVERLPDYPDALTVEAVPLGRLQRGNVVRIAAGQAFPGDGTVLEGRSAADEAILTGESRPVSKSPGSAVIAGSHNLSGPLVVRLERLGSDSRFGQMVELMEKAAAQKPRSAVLAERYAGAFLVGVLLLSIASGLAWWFIDPSRALWVAVSVLIVTCPCALSLATPAAMVAVTGRLAKRGVLACRPEALERLAQCNRVVFDKTGTLTADSMQLSAVDCLRPEWTAARAVAVAIALEQGSLHPVARAFRQATIPHALLTATEVQETAGAGVAGIVNGASYRLGAPAFAVPHAADAPTCEAAVLLADADGAIAAFRFDERALPDAGAAVAALNALGLPATILSGDRPAAVARIAAQLGVADARSGLSPEGKLQAASALQSDGAVVLMVGDGLNDAPVLARADVSIAVGTGAPLSQAQADLVLLTNKLDALPAAVVLARRTQRIVRQNLAWAIAYNTTCVPLALLGFLPPWLAGLGMAASSLAVVANALRLARG